MTENQTINSMLTFFFFVVVLGKLPFKESFMFYVLCTNTAGTFNLIMTKRNKQEKAEV